MRDRVVGECPLGYKVCMPQPKPVIIIHDRYSAVGKPRPDPHTVCKGPCEGMGFYPDMKNAAKLPATVVPFVKCPRCKGTGLDPC